MRGAVLFVCLCLAGWAHAEPIGLANHNPGNILSFHPEAWPEATGNDAWGHLQFGTDLDGLEAMRVVLWAYYRRYHINTVSGIVNRWVRRPRTQKERLEIRGYLLGVAQRAGVEPNERLWFENKKMMAKVAHGLVYAENGSDPYPESLYQQAFGY